MLTTIWQPFTTVFYTMTTPQSTPATLPNAELLKQLFNALPDSAQGGADISGIYVNRSPDNEHDAVANLHQFISWAPGSSDTYLFSGLRGAGKTTELSRLVAELRKDAAAHAEAERVRR